MRRKGWRGAARRLAAWGGVLVALTATPALAQVTIFTDGFEGGNPLAWNPPTVLRLSDLDLRDPHVFVVLPVFGCSDVTDTTPLGDGVNPMIEEAWRRRTPTP